MKFSSSLNIYLVKELFDNANISQIRRINLNKISNTHLTRSNSNIETERRDR